MGQVKYSAIQSKRGESLNDIFESAPYRQLTEAIRQNDGPRAGAIIAEQIAATTGEEHFFWLTMQVSARLRYATTPRQKLDHWPAIVALAREAGPDPDRQRAAVGHAQVILLEAERVTELARFCLSHRPGYALFMRNRWAHYFNRAILHALCGKWKRAYHAYTRSLEAFRQLPEAQLSAILGYVAGLLAERSICACRLGRLDSAEADIREAAATREMMKGERKWIDDLAEAELALHKGQYDRAKSMLQSARVLLNGDGMGIYPRGLIRLELLAARIARAQGNMVSFHHFATRALAVATEHDLQLSQAEVRRVLAGAPA